MHQILNQITIDNENREAVEKKEREYKDLEKWILNTVANHTAGSPTDEKVKWTDLHPREIAEIIKSEHRVSIYHGCIKRVLKANGFVKRKPIKSLSTGQSEHREEQFKIVLHLISLISIMPHNPILSIDTKKKERLGTLTRNAPVLADKDNIPKVYSSDYAHLSTGRVIPHGIFDIKLCKGYISLGNSNETAAFIVDCLEWWWFEYGQFHYQEATHILILCDCGGSNGYRHHLFKVLLQKLARKIGLRIVIAHYPPYCSKYNPIERKLFSHVHRTIKNTILVSIEQVRELMQKTKHSKGLTVVVRIVDKFYPKKQPSNKEDIDEKRILKHPDLPQFSYTILP